MRKTGTRPASRVSATPADPLALFFAKALELHRQGSLAQAQALYEHILSRRADHADALHMSGVLHMQTGHDAQGVALVRKALTVRPDLPDAHANLGNGLMRLGLHTEALHAFEQALSLSPGSAHAHYNKALALMAINARGAALQSCEQALALQPRHPEALNVRGNLLRAQGDIAGALANFDAALAQRPRFADAHNNRGLALGAAGRTLEALQAYEAALVSRPDHAEALYNRAVSLRALGRLDDALASVEAALGVRPHYAEALHARGGLRAARGDTLGALQDFDAALGAGAKAISVLNDAAGALLDAREPIRAEAITARALAIDPCDPPALTLKGRALGLQRRHAKALACFETVLAQTGLQPAFLAAAHDGRAGALMALRRHREALQAHGRAIALAPATAAFYNNRALSYAELGEHEAALRDYASAISIEPHYVAAHVNRALTQLVTGNWSDGLPEYEWRLRRGTAAPAWVHEIPRWHGDMPLAGKRIVLWAEQGLGDTLMCCRFANTLAERGAVVVLAVQEPLRKLLGAMPAVSQVMKLDEPPPADLHCPLMSLPYELGLTPAALPHTPAYLHPPADLREAWHSRVGRLAPPGALRIGLCSAGNPLHLNDENRSTSLSALARLARPDRALFLIQKDLPAADEAVLAQAGIHDLRPWLDDFADTAAAVSSMDLVISVDSSVAHLSGALHRPTYLMLPCAPDWRWQLHREDSPWYPTAHLFRQTAPGDWDGVISRIAISLDTLHR